MSLTDYSLLFLTAGIGYLIGAIPFAVIIARFKGANIFDLGSGNPGATNVLRNLGKPAGYTCFLLDALKGFVAASWPCFVFPEQAALFSVVGLLAAILGHSFSVFIGFRGGKGVATTIGGLLAVNWLMILIAVGVWLVVFYIWKYVSLASICMALSLPLSSFLLQDRPLPEKVLVAALAILIVVRHKSNIIRILQGTEHRFLKK